MTVAAPFDPRDVAWQQDNHFGLGMMIASVRLAVGPSWRPAEVHLQTDEAPGLRDAESLAGARIAFRQPDTMVAIPRALLAARFPPVPPTEIPADVEDWQSSAPARDFAASIRQAVETLSCGEDYPSVRQTADFVGLSVRTLQRRLAAAGVSHQMLVAQTRFATAAVVLEKTNGQDPRPRPRSRVLRPCELHSRVPAVGGMLAAGISTGTRRRRLQRRALRLPERRRCFSRPT